MKKTFFIFPIVFLLSCFFCSCQQNRISIKAKNIKYEETLTTSQVLSDDYLRLMFGDIMEADSKKEYDLYSFDLRIKNNTDYPILSCYTTKVIDVNGKEILATEGRDIKGANILVSPENKYLGLSERYSIQKNKSETLVYQILVEKNQIPNLKASYCCLTGEKMEYTEIPFVIGE